MDGSSLQIGCLGPGVEQSALEFLPKRIEKSFKKDQTCVIPDM